VTLAKSVQRFPRYFIHKQIKTQTNDAKNETFRRSLYAVKISELYANCMSLTFTLVFENVNLKRN